MSSIQVGETYTLDKYLNGSTKARVLRQTGQIFKKYECAVWGVDNEGKHVWPNGSVRTFTNILTKKELLKLAPKAPKGTADGDNK